MGSEGATNDALPAEGPVEGDLKVTFFWREPVRATVLFVLAAVTLLPLVIGVIEQGWPESWRWLIWPIASALMLYAGVARLINRTIITATRGRIEIWHEPLPLWFPRTFTFEHLRAVRVDQWIKRRASGGQSEVVEVQARFDDSSRWVTLIEPDTVREAQDLAGALDRYIVSRIR